MIISKLQRLGNSTLDMLRWHFNSHRKWPVAQRFDRIWVISQTSGLYYTIHDDMLLVTHRLTAVLLLKAALNLTISFLILTLKWASRISQKNLRTERHPYRRWGLMLRGGSTMLGRAWFGMTKPSLKACCQVKTHSQLSVMIFNSHIQHHTKQIARRQLEYIHLITAWFVEQ